MNNFKQILGVKQADLIPDPRPDLTEDSALWSRLLTLAKAEDECLNNKTTVKQEQTGSFFGVLHGFRCAGTRLKRLKSSSGMYVLRPDIDPTGERAWLSQEEYEQFRDRYLAPWKDVLVRVLQRL